jgi:hypothetical protein
MQRRAGRVALGGAHRPVGAGADRQVAGPDQRGKPGAMVVTDGSDDASVRVRAAGDGLRYARSRWRQRDRND